MIYFRLIYQLYYKVIYGIIILYLVTTFLIYIFIRWYIVMYSNYFLVDEEFLNQFDKAERDFLSNFAYSFYKKIRRTKSNMLSKEDFLKSKRTNALSISWIPRPKQSIP